MNIQPIKIKETFIGRKLEKQQLALLSRKEEPSLLVVYGRRRVGKTELVEQSFGQRNLLKFEGVAGKSEDEQKQLVLWQLAEYTNNPLYKQLAIPSWIEIFKLIANEIPDGAWTLYFEEIQWLASYQDQFISELKYAWDNYFKNKSQFILILCGSAPSFIINQVLASQALYNRSQYEIHLTEFNIAETHAFLGKPSYRETMDAFLSIGGIPEYLAYAKDKTSIFTSICQHAFLPNSFFSKESERIFVSSMAESKHYREIIEFLAKQRFATRAEMLKSLKISSGGMLTSIFQDLELCGFIEKYTPYNLNENSKLVRYCIADNYLRFYYKFIAPIQQEIQNADFVDTPTRAINQDTYYKWLGFAFERFCRRQHRLIAKILGFSGIKYRAGVFFNRATDKTDRGYQFDLIFDRDDKVITLCEIKYLQSKVTSRVIQDFESKLAYFPNPRNKTIHKVLITTEGIDDGLLRRHYFDSIITLEDIFEAAK